jgi:hypothetical protein
MLKFYADATHYNPRDRKSLVAILRAHWNDETPADRAAIYGTRYTDYQPVDDVAEADVCLLPMNWQYYVKTDQVAKARDLARQAAGAGKLIAVWVGGDLYTTVPIDNALIIQSSMYESRRGPRHYAAPAFFDDYVPQYYAGTLDYRRKGDRPVVGFCGQAGNSLQFWGKWTMQHMAQQARYRTGRVPYEPAPLYPPARLRADVLRILQQDPRIADNFILRDRYWGGAATADEKANAREQARLDFVHNLHDSDYIVCVRGTGNYSKRLYEALSMGRIPIFVDTDCTLPYDFAVNWRDYCVWVDRRDIPRIADIVADFHARISPDDFVALQQACRTLWQDRLSFEGFYTHFHEHLDPAHTPPLR